MRGATSDPMLQASYIVDLGGLHPLSLLGNRRRSMVATLGDTAHRVNLAGVVHEVPRARWLRGNARFPWRENAFCDVVLIARSEGPHGPAFHVPKFGINTIPLEFDNCVTARGCAFLRPINLGVTAQRISHPRRSWQHRVDGPCQRQQVRIVSVMRTLFLVRRAVIGWSPPVVGLRSPSYILPRCSQAWSPTEVRHAQQSWQQR